MIYTCLLTAVAAIVVLLAYLAATGRPDLDIEVTFNFSSPNEPVFLAEDDDDGIAGSRRRKSFKQTWATVTLNNSSEYRQEPGCPDSA